MAWCGQLVVFGRVALVARLGGVESICSRTRYRQRPPFLEPGSFPPHTFFPLGFGLGGFDAPRSACLRLSELRVLGRGRALDTSHIACYAPRHLHTPQVSFPTSSCSYSNSFRTRCPHWIIQPPYHSKGQQESKF